MESLGSAENVVTRGEGLLVGSYQGQYPVEKAVDRKDIGVKSDVKKKERNRSYEWLILGIVHHQKHIFPGNGSMSSD